MSQVACFVWCEQTMSLYHSPVRQKKKKRFEHCRLFLLLLKGGTILYTWSKYLSTAKSHIHNPEPALEASQVSVLIASGCYTEIFPFFFCVSKKKKTLPFILKVMAPLEKATRCFTMSHEYCQIRGCGRKLKLSFINTHPKYTAETCTCIFIYTIVKLECFSENATSLARGRELFCSAHVYPVGAGNRYRRWKLSFVALKRTSGSPEAQLSCGRFFFIFFFAKSVNFDYTL